MDGQFEAPHLSSEFDQIRLKMEDLFLVCDRNGNINADHADHGLYWGGTRLLHGLSLEVESHPPEGLSNYVADDGTACSVDFAMRSSTESQGIDHAQRDMHLHREISVNARTLTESLTFTNYYTNRIDLAIHLHILADFKDILEIRGFQNDKRGQVEPSVLSAGELKLAYLGRDNVARAVRIIFAPQVSNLTDELVNSVVGTSENVASISAEWRVQLTPGTPVTLSIAVDVWEGDPKTPEAQRWPSSEREREEPLRSQRLPSLVSDNTFFNQALTRGMHDLVMMCARTPEGLYPYGGIPWYVCPFGRDALITSLEFLPWFPDVANGTLAFLASRQGTKVDAFTEEQPGKILHELRRGELANLREIPFIPYYGTVDATPLFLILLEQYIRWTDDIAFLKRMWPHAVAAARWMVDYGGNGPDGFLRYHRSESTGLVNQGWKDSWDAISHADGRLAEGPIALCEVQSYAYAAYEAMAWLAKRAGHANQQQEWRRHASTLRSAFIDKFWWPEQQCYYLALDGSGEPCKVVNSNAGQALWGGIAPKEHAEAIVERLHHSDMYTEWGIRTLSSQAVRYNPMSYHNGSVWPHDTAMIGAGFARYGFREEAARLLGNLYGVSLHYEGARLPELFCGFSRMHGYGPTRYPVACSPQSWAAGAPFLLISSILGFEPDAAHGRIALRRPMLPEWLHRLEMRGLRVGGHNGQLRFDRSGNETAVVLSQYSEIDIQVLPL